MKATATPIRELKDQYVCRRCGIIRTTATGRDYDTCRDCRIVEKDLADPERIARLDRQLDGPKQPPRTKPRTHCIHGHELTEDNTLLIGGKRPRRRCRTCNHRRILDLATLMCTECLGVPVDDPHGIDPDGWVKDHRGILHHRDARKEQAS